jgi:hypothetical protein
MVLGQSRGMTKTSSLRASRASRPAAAAVAFLLALGLSPTPWAIGSAICEASPENSRAPATAERIESEPQRFGFGQPMRVDEGERVDSIVTIGNDLTVLGSVENDAIVIGGTLELGPRASIGGDAVAIGGAIVDLGGGPGSARIVGDRTEVSGAFGHGLARSDGDRGRDGDRDWPGPLATSLATFIQVFAAFLISALLLAFAPKRVRGVAEQIQATPGRALVFGFAILLLFLPLLGALTISIVGIPLIPVTIMALAAILVFGMTGLALAIGQLLTGIVQRSTPGLGSEAAERRSGFAELVLGYVVIGLIAWIPYVGAMLIPLAALFAAGSVIAKWFAD